MMKTQQNGLHILLLVAVILLVSLRRIDLRIYQEEIEKPAVVSRKPPRVLLGILTADFESEIETRRRHVQMIRLWNDPRVCSLDQLRSSLDTERCELIWTFVLGGNPAASTGLYNETERPFELSRSQVSLPQDLQQDTSISAVFLNIRENMEEGKSPTWFAYGAKIAKEYNLDYVAKCDTDTVLLYPELFQFGYRNLLAAPYNQRTYVGHPMDKLFAPRMQSWLRQGGREFRKEKEGFFEEHFFRVHIYARGQLYILSTDLAQFVATQADDCSYCQQIEDHDIGSMVLHSPDPIKFLIVGTHQKFWEHPVKVDHQEQWNEILEREKARARQQQHG